MKPLLPTVCAVLLNCALLGTAAAQTQSSPTKTPPALQRTERGPDWGWLGLVGLLGLAGLLGQPSGETRLSFPKPARQA